MRRRLSGIIYILRLLLILILILFQVTFVVGLSVFAKDFLSYYYVLEYFFVMITILFINYQSQRISIKLTWMVFIALFPPEGMIAYFCYYFILRIKLFTKKHILIQAKTKYLELQNKDIINSITDADIKQQAELIYKQSRYPISKNTECTYLPVGEDYYRELIIELKKAKKYIFMQYFIISKGEMLDELMKIMIEKASQGVEVYFSYDVAGSITTRPSNFEDFCLSYNINVLPFNKNIESLYQFISYRDHRKITVVDGIVAFTGGINIGDEYINKNVRFGHWKDMGIKLYGDGAKNLTMIFMKGWNFSNPDTFIYENYLANSNSHNVVNDTHVISYDDGPFSDDDVAEKTYIRMISNAKKYIYITTPYLIPSVDIISALKIAAQSGVDVKILTPGIPDKKIIYECTRANYVELINFGVKIYEYTPGFVHGKTCVSDDKVAFVGSINFDFRSLIWNYECGSWVFDKNFALTVKDDLLNAFSKSELITKKTLAKAPIGTKIFRSAISLLGPLL